MADGCDDVIDDEEFRILLRRSSQFGEDLGATRVTPVVKDLRTRISCGGRVRTCLRTKTEASLIG